MEISRSKKGRLKTSSRRRVKGSGSVWAGKHKTALKKKKKELVGEARNEHPKQRQRSDVK
jgi:hypothetical protein